MSDDLEKIDDALRLIYDAIGELNSAVGRDSLDTSYTTALGDLLDEWFKERIEALEGK